MSSFKLIVWSGSCFTTKSCFGSHLSPRQAHIVLQAAEGQRFNFPGNYSVGTAACCFQSLIDVSVHRRRKPRTAAFATTSRKNSHFNSTQGTVRWPRSSRTPSSAAALIYGHYFNCSHEARLLKLYARQLAYSRKSNIFSYKPTFIQAFLLHKPTWRLDSEHGCCMQRQTNTVKPQIKSDEAGSRTKTRGVLVCDPPAFCSSPRGAEDNALSSDHIYCV